MLLKLNFSNGFLLLQYNYIHITEAKTQPHYIRQKPTIITVTIVLICYTQSYCVSFYHSKKPQIHWPPYIN